MKDEALAKKGRGGRLRRQVGRKRKEEEEEIEEQRTK